MWCRMTILSSRENTCIHPQVSAYPNKNEACTDMLDVSSASTLIVYFLIDSFFKIRFLNYAGDDCTGFHTARTTL